VLASQPQWPVVVSHSPFAQAAQATPPKPHWLPVCVAYVTHVAPLQQPPPHEVESQTQAAAVLLQSWPTAHGPQVSPAVPHEAVVSDAQGTQAPVIASQHPFGHEFASQTQAPTVLHSCPEGHAAHATPPVPHEELDSPE
jgi:hypothetical protein